MFRIKKWLLSYMLVFLQIYVFLFSYSCVDILVIIQMSPSVYPLPTSFTANAILNKNPKALSRKNI